MKSLVQLLLLIVFLHVAESLPCVRLCYFRVLSQCPLLHQKIRVWLIRGGRSVVVKLTVSSVQVFLVLNCRRNSNSDHRGFKRRGRRETVAVLVLEFCCSLRLLTFQRGCIRLVC